MNYSYLTLAIAIMLCGCVRQPERIELDSETNEKSSYVFIDNTMGTVVKASDPSDIGQKITFVGLQTSTPKVVFEDGFTESLRKVHESERTLTAISVGTGPAGLSSIDAFVIDKKTGKFARAAAGSVVRVSAAASVGTLR